MDNKIPFAKQNSTGRMVSVFDVKKGLACDCICPECKKQVEACKGPKRFYFRHKKNWNVDYICENAKESSLHEMAKQILAESNEIWLPVKLINYGNQAGGNRVYAMPKHFQISTVDVEKWQGKLKPDIIISDGNKIIYVEIYVTHKVDENKTCKIAEKDIPVLEIDLSDFKYDELANEEKLSKILIGRNNKKRWVYFDKKSYTFEQKYEQSKKLYVDSNENEFNVHGCPKNINFNIKGDEISKENCKECIFCASIEEFEDKNGGYIVCTAKLGESLKDRTLSKDKAEKILADEREKRLRAYEDKKRNIEERKQVIKQNVNSEINWVKRTNELNENKNKQIERESKHEQINQEYSIPNKNSRKEEIQNYMHGQLDDKKLVAVNHITNTPWKRCSICGYEGDIKEFTFKSYKSNVNLGICKKCANSLTQKEGFEPSIRCPQCGRKLVKKSGIYGMFMACTGYPKCRYTYSIDKNSEKT